MECQLERNNSETILLTHPCKEENVDLCDIVF